MLARLWCCNWQTGALIPDMSPNYARLCLPYVLATALSRGMVTVEDFDAAAIAEESRQALAARVRVQHDGSTHDNALAPVGVTVRLDGGTQHTVRVDEILGHPNKPLSRDEYLDKFRRCCESARRPRSAPEQDTLIGLCERLESLPDAKELLDHLMS